MRMFQDHHFKTYNIWRFAHGVKGILSLKLPGFLKHNPWPMLTPSPSSNRHSRTFTLFIYRIWMFLCWCKCSSVLKTSLNIIINLGSSLRLKLQTFRDLRIKPTEYGHLRLWCKGIFCLYNILSLNIIHFKIWMFRDIHFNNLQTMTIWPYDVKVFPSLKLTSTVHCHLRLWCKGIL